METLQKATDELLAFYDAPAEHWHSIRLRTAKTRGCVTHNTILSLAFKLGLSAQKRWRRLRGYRWLDALERGITFIDGVAQYEDTNNHRSAA